MGKESSTTVVTFRLAPELRSLAEKRACRDGLSFSAWLRRLVFREVVDDLNPRGGNGDAE
jgi:hypothetical protein